MGSPHHHPLTASNHPLLPLLLTLLVTARCSLAQSPASNSNNGPPYLNNTNFNPSMAIVIVVLISAFFFLGFFSIYIRQCAGARNVAGHSIRGAGNTGRSRRQRGLDPEVLASFPTLVYSDVKAHKIGKDSLECAVCLSEFEDDETLRLLPKCDHVFHPDCIDAWLAAHVTCPVCRSNLTDPPPAGPTADHPASENIEPAHEPPVEHLVVEVEDDHRQQPEHEEEERRTEIDTLERFVNMKRARSRARPPPAIFPRSHSTGHSLVLPSENLDRFTLRLPENIRKEIVQRAEMLQRTKSLVVFPGEESSRRGYRDGGDGSGRGSRSTRIGRSDRWGSFLLRTLSTKMPNWGRRGGGDVDGSTSARGGGGFSRRGDSIKGGEGSSVSKAAGGFFRRGDSMKGEGSARRFNAVIAPFDCYGSDGAKENSLEARDGDSQSSTAALNRV